ncbi:hypothetical protein ACWCXK_06100 [Streptomyces sp. NPDC001739]
MPDTLVGTAVMFRGPLVIDGHTRVCSQCGANRDWLVLLAHATEQIFVRCRCSHEWHEPGVTPIWFHSICGPTTAFCSHDQLQTKGFDGTTPPVQPHPHQGPSPR